MAEIARAFEASVEHCAELVRHPSTPPHPANAAVLPWNAVSVTVVPAVNAKVHVVPPLPQLMPAGDDVTELVLIGPKVETTTLNVAQLAGSAATAARDAAMTAYLIFLTCS